MTSTVTPDWLRDCGASCVLDIAVQPGAKRSELVGLHDGALRIRIAAPALDGRGNTALCAWLAEQLGCPRRDVQLLRGERARRKQVAVERDAASVLAKLQPLIDAQNLFQ